MQVLHLALRGARRAQGHHRGLRALRLAAPAPGGAQLRLPRPRLLALADWLAEHDCTHVAMEATGVYWKPVWHILEADFELVLANAAHIKNVPGRKTDVNDAMWIADLLAHGLIRSSFVPPQAIQQLRDLTRTRKQLVREVSRHSLRIQKVLEDANLKLGSVLSDVLRQSGRAMLDAIVAGQSDPGRLAELAQGTARNKSAELRRGAARAHHRASPHHAQAAPAGRSMRSSARSPSWTLQWEKRWRRSSSAPAS